MDKAQKVKLGVYGVPVAAGLFLAGPVGAIIGGGIALATRYFGYGYFGTVKKPEELLP